MRFLFWNTKRNNNINAYIKSIIDDNAIDIVILAEYTADGNEISEWVSNRGRLIKGFTSGCERINIWSSYPQMTPSVQEKHYSIQILDDFVICSLHLMSDLRRNQADERMERIQRMMHDVIQAESEINSQKTIIVGDFNAMPYEKTCLSANGLHGLPSLNEKEKSTRTVDNIQYRKFYNPMWNLMGDFSFPPGTYYLNEAKLYSPMWYMLDQVIISRDVMKLFNKSSLKILTTCSYSDLTDKNNHPNKRISDHFPIVFEVEKS